MPFRSCEPLPEFDVLLDRQMRKELCVLKDESDAAPMRRHENTRLGIGQDVAGNDDAAAIGTLDARDQIEDGCLARAGGSKQGGQGTIAFEGDVEGEIRRVFGML